MSEVLPDDPFKAILPFGKLTDDQKRCQERMSEVQDRLISIKGKEMYLKELIIVMEGLSPEDRDEPVTESSFSEYRFYKYFVEKMIYFVQQFDFLVRCISNGICVVHNTRNYHLLLDTILTPPRQDFKFPKEIISYDQLREEDEMRRIESFTLTKDWVSAYP